MIREIFPRFADPFVVITNFLDDELNKTLTEKVQNFSKTWVGKGKEIWESAEKSPKNSFGLDGHSEVNEFNLLSMKVTEEVQDLGNYLGSSHKFVLKNAWYNLYNKNNFQEYHVHSPCLFSAIYFCKIPKGSSPVTFFDFSRQAKALPSISYSPDENPMFIDSFIGGSEENSLIIFRSHIPHNVRFGDNDDDRITFSFNFD